MPRDPSSSDPSPPDPHARAWQDSPLDGDPSGAAAADINVDANDATAELPALDGDPWTMILFCDDDDTPKLEALCLTLQAMGYPARLADHWGPIHFDDDDGLEEQDLHEDQDAHDGPGRAVDAVALEQGAFDARRRDESAEDRPDRVPDRVEVLNKHKAELHDVIGAILDEHSELDHRIAQRKLSRQRMQLVAGVIVLIVALLLITGVVRGA